MASSHLRAIAAITMTALLVSVAACNVSDDQIKAAPQGPGTLHLQNGGIPAGPIDVYIDGTKSVSNLAFADTITIAGVGYGTHVLRYANAGVNDTLPVPASQIFVSTSRMYTEVLSGDQANAGLQQVGGQVSAASVSPATNAGLRIYNTVDAADYLNPPTDTLWGDNLGIVLTGQTTNFVSTTLGVSQFNAAPLLTNGQAAAGYLSLPPDTYTLVVYNSDFPADTLLKNVTITLKAGQLRTAILAGFNPAATTIQLVHPMVADSGQ